MLGIGTQNKLIVVAAEDDRAVQPDGGRRLDVARGGEPPQLPAVRLEGVEVVVVRPEVDAVLGIDSCFGAPIFATVWDTPSGFEFSSSW